jgi:hypothetical protein
MAKWTRGELKVSETYFSKVTDWSVEFLSTLGLDASLKPLDQVLSSLQPLLEQRRGEAIAGLRNCGSPTSGNRPELDSPIGLNCVGMLVDRLTILVLKEWFVRKANPENADAWQKIRVNLTLPIIEALGSARPMAGSFASKISVLDGDAHAESWEEAFYGLLASNLLLWEAQQILYLGDILALPCEELRGYIRWFSVGNMRRTKYIDLCETLYWRS